MIDVSLFGATIPAGSYTAGDTVELKIIDGPANVRSGRGPAILKRLTAGMLIGNTATGAASFWTITVKNSDWIDEAGSSSAPLDTPTALDVQSGCVQDGQNCPLTPNSSWTVIATSQATITTTIDNSVFAAIEIDYPQVASITDPRQLVGFPTTIQQAITADAQKADIEAATWKTINVDFLKAGFEYAMVKPELKVLTGPGITGFLKMSNAAGMGGLSRIIPISGASANVRNFIEYASKLVKGPMDISVMFFSTTGTASTGESYNIILDFVKHKV